jgi:hypothetical protein
MVTTKPTTVKEYLAGLPPERRSTIAKVRDVVRRNLPSGYREVMNWGMVTYELPLERYPDTYNGRPLCYAAIAAHKNHNALYLMGAYQDAGEAAQLREAFRKAGKKMDMGRSCLRFREADELPLEAIGRVIRDTPPAKFIARYETSRRKPTRKKSAAARPRTAAARKPSPRRRARTSA